MRMCITIAGNFRNEGKRLVECLQEGEITVESLENVKAHIPSVQRECDERKTSTRQLEEVAVGYLNGAKVIHNFTEEGAGRVVFACRLNLQGPLAFGADLATRSSNGKTRWDGGISAPNTTSVWCSTCEAHGLPFSLIRMSFFWAGSLAGSSAATTKIGETNGTSVAALPNARDG
eukprot:GHVT01069197.1.p1 GENE.GHVT01069197.1~~GHVT01069197.1.p1  ORF type:complete len:175 (+),score=13.90 GHVT01069197.1:1086-1610(+)